jgi:transposase
MLQEPVRMVLSTYEKQRILFFHQKGFSPSEILSAVTAENIVTTRQTIARFIKRFSESGSIFRKEGSGRPSKISKRVLELVERRMREDDETTAVQLHTLLTACGISISLSTILRSRSSLGWTYRGSKYCQLIRSHNKHKRFQWAYENYMENLNNGFEDVIWTDETTVQLEPQEALLQEKR